MRVQGVQGRISAEVLAGVGLREPTSINGNDPEFSPRCSVRGSEILTGVEVLMNGNDSKSLWS